MNKGGKREREMWVWGVLAEGGFGIGGDGSGAELEEAGEVAHTIGCRSRGQVPGSGLE